MQQEASMAAQSSMVHVRIDNALKEQASEALAAMGLTTADAVRLLFHRIVAEQALPLELKVPNAATRAAMAEAAEMMAARKQRFTSSDAMIAALDERS
jgi:DNA-damage-inducible protein J